MRADAEYMSGRNGGIISVYLGLEFNAALHTCAEQDPRDFQFGHCRAAVLRSYSTVICGHQHDGVFRPVRIFDFLQHVSDQLICHIHRRVIGWGAVSVMMACVIHVIEMDEKECRLLFAKVFNRVLHRVGWPDAVFNFVRCLTFKKAAKSIPIMETSDDRGRLLLPELAEDSREHCAGAANDWLYLELVRLPII